MTSQNKKKKHKNSFSVNATSKNFVEAYEKAKQRYPIESYPYASEGLQRAYVEGYLEALKMQFTMN